MLQLPDDGHVDVAEVEFDAGEGGECLSYLGWLLCFVLVLSRGLSGRRAWMREGAKKGVVERG